MSIFCNLRWLKEQWQSERSQNKTHLLIIKSMPQTEYEVTILHSFLSVFLAMIPAWRLLKQLIIDELTCKSIMQICRQSQWLMANNTWVNNDRNEQMTQDCLFDFALWSVSYLHLQCDKNMFLCETVTTVVYLCWSPCNPRMKSSIVLCGHHN